MVMSEHVIMRCGANVISVAKVTRDCVVTDASFYSITDNPVGVDDAAEWLELFAQAVNKIPKNIRRSVSFVIPPNKHVVVSYINIPDVTDKNKKEAFQFECSGLLPGGKDEWEWDIYQPFDGSNYAYVFGIRHLFAEQFIDILLRNKIQFKYICPEVLLNNIAVKQYFNIAGSVTVANVGSQTSVLSCLSHSAEYLRSIPMSASDLTRTISDAQKISAEQSVKLQDEFFSGTETDNSALMAYYTKQFIQRLNQEIKRSELFYCRTFQQVPVSTIILTGKARKLCRYFRNDDNISVIDVSEMSSRYIAISDADKSEQIKDDICSFVGAAYCINNKKTNFLNGLVSNFVNQSEFQRQNIGYLLLAVAVTLVELTVLKICSKDVLALEVEKEALSAKLVEMNTDSIRLREASDAAKKYHKFIHGVQMSFDSQAEWSNLLHVLQSHVESLKTAWIDSMEWNDDKVGNGRQCIHFVMKQWMEDSGRQKEYYDHLERFIEKLSNNDMIDHVENLSIDDDGNVVSLSFDTILRTTAKMVML